MIGDCLGLLEAQRGCKDFTLDDVPGIGCHFITPALVAVGVGATTAAIAGPVLAAGLGAAGSALTGGNPLQGALIGGGISALGGVTGLTGDIGGMFGQDAPGLGTALGVGSNGVDSSAYTPATIPGVTDANIQTAGTLTNSGLMLPGNNIQSANSLGPLASFGSIADSGGGLSGSGASSSSGLGGAARTLGALAALGSAFSQPNYTTPGPASTAQQAGPYFNVPLNNNVPGRTAVNPLPWNGGGTNPYYTYGQGPEQNFFTNNSTAAFGNGAAAPGATAHAKGGAIRGALVLARGGGFSTGNGVNHVEGPGDGTSDSVPARLSSGEYVLTAADVSRLGAGSNDAGAQKLDRFRKELAHKAGERQFIPDKVKGALASLGSR